MKSLLELINEGSKIYILSDEVQDVYNEIRKKFDDGELDCEDRKYKKSKIIRPGELQYGQEYIIFMNIPEEYKMRFKKDLDDNEVVSDVWCALGVSDLFGRIYIQNSIYNARLKWMVNPEDNFRYRFSKKTACWYLNVGKEGTDDFLSMPVDVCVHKAEDFIKEYENQ